MYCIVKSYFWFQIRHLEVSRHAFDGLSVTGSFLLKDVVMRTVVSLAFRSVVLNLGTCND